MTMHEPTTPAAPPGEAPEADWDALVATAREIGAAEEAARRWRLEPEFPAPTDAERTLLPELARALAAGPRRIASSGLQLRLTPGIDPWIAYLLLADAYEPGDLELIARHVPRGGEGLVFGGGIGVIATALAHALDGPVTVVEANPALLPLIAETGRLNGCDLRPRHGAILPGRAGGTVAFTLSAEFWSSSVRAETWRAAQAIEVPVLDPAPLLAGATCLFVDVEGAEADLFEGVRLPPGLTRVFVEIHRGLLGGPGAARVMNAFWDQGYRLLDQVGLTSAWGRLDST